MDLRVCPDTVKGFLSAAEGAALYHLAGDAARLGPCLEIGSYCGKSTLYLGSACRRAGAVLYAVDHHRGSEEHQPGEGYHDPELYDPGIRAMDSLPAFRALLRRARLEDTVVPIVAPSALAARHWHCPLGLVFIDGGHSLDAAMTDYRAWAPHVLPGGHLLIHDVFPDPAAGGQAPRVIRDLARDSGLFHDEGLVETLGVLRRIPH